MKSVTHVSFVFLLCLILVDPKEPIIFFSVAILASVLPDIDSNKSFLGRKLRPFSDILNLGGHRGILHSIFTGTVLAISISIFSFEIALAFLVGYGSHLLLDSLTFAGVPMLWPFKYKVKGFIETGSIYEYIFLTGILSSILAVYILP